MTVKELIAKLQTLPQDVDVKIWQFGGPFGDHTEYIIDAAHEYQDEPPGCVVLTSESVPIA